MLNGLGGVGIRIIENRWTAWLALIAAVAVSVAAMPHETSDHVRFLHPWMDQIKARGAASISGEFANYTPPYIYLMYLVSGIEGVIGLPAALKLVNIPFVAAAMLASYRIVEPLAGSNRAFLAAAVTWALPTVLVDNFIWGQCDIIYVSLLLWHVRFLMSDQPWKASVAFGAALAFKLQAIFLGPVLLACFLAGRIRLQHLPAVALTFMVMMLPAWLAGRPALDLLLIYLRQADVYRQLSMNAPNLWYLADSIGVPYQDGVRVGLVLTALSGLALSLWLWNRRPTGADLLLAAATSATLMPFLLPKMHDRYMFPADVLVAVLAMVRLRYLWLAVLAQVGSLAAYGGYFGAERYLGGFHTPLIGVVAYGIVAIVLVGETLRLPRNSAAPKAEPT